MKELTSELIVDLRGRLDTELHLILSRSFEMGFLGGMPIDEQVDHALGFVGLVEAELGRAPQSVIDLGTGGGVPGLVLACCWPDARVVLMDGSEKRITFLSEAIQQVAGAEHAQVELGRAEELGHRPDLRELFEVVTSRSFGSPAVTAECGSSFAMLGGIMVISEPPESAETERWPADGLEKVGLVPAGQFRAADRFGYQVIRKQVALDERYPRRVGVPAKRPLF